LPDQEFNLVYVVIYNHIGTGTGDPSCALVAQFEPKALAVQKALSWQPAEM
jgi:hypothetical protein